MPDFGLSYFVSNFYLLFFSLHIYLNILFLFFLVVIAVITLISNSVQGCSFGFSGENLTLRICSMAYAAILRQEVGFFDEERNNNVGTLTSILTLDATQIHGITGMTLGTILQVTATLTSGFIVALSIG